MSGTTQFELPRDNARRTPLEEQIEIVSDTPRPEHSGQSLVIRSGLTVQEMEKTLILETLRSTNNNRTEAAKLLGISIRTLRNKLHEYRGDGIVIEE